MSLHRLLFNPFLFMIILTTTLTLNSLLIVESSSNKKPASGPEINVTKYLSFPNFSTSQDITLLGSAAISTENNCIQIPENNLQYSAGRAIYSSPIRLFDPKTQTAASFTTTFSFQIQNPENDAGPISGGLSFVIVPDELTVGRPGPWLGMMNDACEDEYKVVAVEFDTRMNPEFGDLNDNHVGINLGSIVSTKSINVSDFGVYLNDGKVHRAWIIYDGLMKLFEIYIGPDGILPARAVYSGNLDLSPYLNEYMFVGFSGSTGNNHTEVHTVCSWNFTSVSRASLRVPSTETCESKIIVANGGNNIHVVPSKTPTSFYIFVAVVVLVFIIMINLYLNRKRKDENYSDETASFTKEKHRPAPPNYRARKFNFSEISSATRAFGELQVLGSDTRSVTYKGTLVNGCNVAVKRFYSKFFSSRGSERRRLIKEVKLVGKIRHPNIVPIRGWSFDRQETIVVYNFAPNGSLDKWLLGFGVLPWTRRFKVVKDVAEALSYLHSKELAHKNVKASSVFLDISFRALVGDFGFVLSSMESTRFESLVSQKVDVFEFGVLVLEVVSGRARRSGPGEMDLLDLAWAMHVGGEKGKLVDRRMGPVVNPDQANRALEVGLMCTLNDNKGRPTMEEVVEYLNFEKPVPELPRTRPVSLFPYSSTTGLCSGYSCSFK
ncbi:hypothetical protein MIMGU_mgv1a002529mg [Erythranthe guttata]|uniref:non-specific serine/threonine protein kinase n=1 Tax=Erythranthe guttata TaxID=4155 RepID=A0A022S085_ERYGU|nr:PREDICTED: L-type lectin-domain containing receptor kinase VIII.1-like [Erythranthe guttata]EYU45338.1 hypothetical protein MIMGU_mgv1a002529mg [Erythranthe guttata]|eukprot:XP_012843638.1 PREDICTED: L-type lectin-domain containing receptor kinase VIII.1-like [Erythranthe guttata]